MTWPLRSLLTLGAVLVSFVSAQVDPKLTGTWTTKSRKVVTGPVGTPFLHTQVTSYKDAETIPKWQNKRANLICINAGVLRSGE